MIYSKANNFISRQLEIKKKESKIVWASGILPIVNEIFTITNSFILMAVVD